MAETFCELHGGKAGEDNEARDKESTKELHAEYDGYRTKDCDDGIMTRCFYADRLSEFFIEGNCEEMFVTEEECVKCNYADDDAINKIFLCYS